MAERSERKRQAKKPLLGNHQRCWIWGRHLVLETLKARKWPIYELRLGEDLAEDERQLACRLADELDIAYSLEPVDVLNKLCGSKEHQGFLAKMPPYPYDELSSLETAWPVCPLLMLLDAIQDSHNFGAILRSAEILAVDAVVIGSRDQAGVNSQVARSSAGAVNHLKIIRETNLAQTLARWKNKGLVIFGASEKAELPLNLADFAHPLVLVIGNEARGISAEVLNECDQLVAIPQSGRVGSLNAAVSAGILLYEVNRQRNFPNR